MKKYIKVGILVALTLLLVVVKSNKREEIKELSPTLFEKITGDKAKNNIGYVPTLSEETIKERKLEELKKKKEEEERKKQEEIKKAKQAAKKKKINQQTQVKQTNVAYNKSELQSYAHSLVISYGWSEYDFECLVNLWNRESGWSPNAVNKRSGACGIPQSLPCNKMASHGSDYRTNGKTQIRWGLDYIKNRYGSPANAWAHSQQTGWY